MQKMVDCGLWARGRGGCVVCYLLVMGVTNNSTDDGPPWVCGRLPKEAKSKQHDFFFLLAYRYMPFEHQRFNTDNLQDAALIHLCARLSGT